LAQDDYYYEIQLTNKQLVFYFMAGAAGLILSFLAGVMVGRGVDTTASAAERSQPLAEERIVSEQPAVAPTPDDYSYPRRLESDSPPSGLERPRPAASTATPAATTVARATPTPAPPKPTPTPTPARPTPTPIKAAPAMPTALAPQSPGHAVQVGAFKDRASADSVMRGLRAKNLPTYVTPPAAGSNGLFSVRVGPYATRGEADIVAARLRSEKFKPYIIKQ
jgi:cell division septation protein DedD